MMQMKIWYTLLFNVLFKSLEVQSVPTIQVPIFAESHTNSGHSISPELFADLEELSRVVDISYCVGMISTGIQKPFQCASRCHEFQDFELVTVRYFHCADALLLIILLTASNQDVEHRPIFL